MLGAHSGSWRSDAACQLFEGEGLSSLGGIGRQPLMAVFPDLLGAWLSPDPAQQLGSLTASVNDASHGASPFLATPADRPQFGAKAEGHRWLEQPFLRSECRLCPLMQVLPCLLP